ncbi:Response regulator receiver protein [Candidatus Sulfopaludibacter sp. SbA3]|nr:Response regulator receiver protein [Candidatus Sulfopaludibacter sp. SbA3]
MAIITISRGTFSGGKALAECLSKRLGYRCIDRDMLVRRAATRRVSEHDLRAALELPPAYPGRFNHTRYIYLVLTQAALTEEVRYGCAIYHGLAGHLLLKGAPGLLRLRIIAPLECRIRMAQERLHLSRGEAMAHIENMDRDRRRWTQLLYGLDWGEPSLYDLVINLERTSIEQACNAVASLVEGGDFELTPEGRIAMDDLALASKVRAALAQDPYTVNLEFEVESHAGSIYVSGDCVEAVAAVQRVVSAVPGVAGLTVDAAVPALH